MSNETITDDEFKRIFQNAAKSLAKLPKEERIARWKKASAELDTPETQHFMNLLFCYSDLVANTQ